MSYYRGKSWRAEWWGQSFPLVLVVTPRLEKIQFLVNKHKGGEIFRVISKPERILQNLIENGNIKEKGVQI